MEPDNKLNCLVNFHLKFSQFSQFSQFSHLKEINQTYIQHFRDAMFYSAVCFKLALCFFIHGLYPDSFVNSSIELSRLNTLIKMKYNESKSKENGKTNSLFYYFTSS